MGQKIFPGSGSASRRKGAGQCETSIPPTNSRGGGCYLKLLGFPNLPVELRETDLPRWCSCRPAVAEQRSRCWRRCRVIAAPSCACTPATAPAWQHGSMKTENTDFFSAELIKKCCRRQRRGQGWLLRAEWRMWLTCHYYAANCCVQSVGWPPPCSQAPPRLTAQLMINEQLSN